MYAKYRYRIYVCVLQVLYIIIYWVIMLSVSILHLKLKEKINNKKNRNKKIFSLLHRNLVNIPNLQFNLTRPRNPS